MNAYERYDLLIRYARAIAEDDEMLILFIKHQLDSGRPSSR